MARFVFLTRPPGFVDWANAARGIVATCTSTRQHRTTPSWPS